MSLTAEIESAPLIEPDCLSHGTLECVDLEKTRKFYEQFLGVNVIRHAEAAMGFWCGGDWFIACVGSGAEPAMQPFANRWGLEVGTAAEVDDAHAAAVRDQEKWEIRQVNDIVQQDGVRSFALQDLDGNWWDIVYRDHRLFDDVFARGDVA